MALSTYKNLLHHNISSNTLYEHPHAHDEIIPETSQVSGIVSRNKNRGLAHLLRRNIQMPVYFITHRHEYGASLYEVDCNFDLLHATQTYPDWPARIAACLQLDYEPHKEEAIEIVERDAVKYTDLTRDEFDEALTEDTDEDDED
jgi:hypothetical protein